MKPSVRLIRLGIGVVSIFIVTVVGFYWFRRDACGSLTTVRARETILRNDLSMIRQAIDNYTLDKQRPPNSLQELVDSRYLREIPTDPFSCKKDWVVPIEEIPLSPDYRAAGIADVHSRSDLIDRGGVAYSKW